jgi:UDP-glucose 4-epimerase
MSLYLVTGGAGFIGSHLTDALLAQGHQVRVLDDFSTGKRANLNATAELVVGDVSDPATVLHAMAGAAACFHLAAIASVQRGNEDWLGTHRVNLGGTIAVLDAARQHNRIPVVYASSAAVYGDTGGEVASETLPCAPQTAYGADKLGAEQHAAIGWNVHGVPSAGLRFFNVYGPRQDPLSPYSGVISIFAGRIAAGQGITLHGDGGQTRDFVYVADVVAHLLAAHSLLERTPGAKLFNVCTGRETSIALLAGVLGQLCDAPPRVTLGPPRPGDIKRSIGDPARAQTQLGVVAATNLECGLRKLLAHVRA